MKLNTSLWVGVMVVLVVGAVLFYTLNSSSNNATQGSAAKSGSTVAGSTNEPESSSSAQAGAVKSAATQAGGTPAMASAAHGANQPLRAKPGRVSTVAGHPVQYRGEFAQASVRVDGQSYQLTPNQVGNFPRILIQPEDRVHVQVAYPQSQAGDAVVVETEDGGNLDGKRTANIVTLDAAQNIEFNFQATSQPGIYHIALRNGPDVKVLSFWAGPEPALRP